MREPRVDSTYYIENKCSHKGTGHMEFRIRISWKDGISSEALF